MFVRFRAGRRRLALSLVETKRIGGWVRNVHVSTLGSVETPLTIRSRLAFWPRFNERLASLGNRLAPEDHSKIMDAVHARIPMVTPDEQRAVQEENAKDNERFWDAMADMNASSVEGHKLLAASAEAKRREHERRAADAVEKRDAARERLAKLKRGEDVAGGLGKKLDMAAMAKAAGLTAKEIKRARAIAELTEAEFATFLERRGEADRIDDRELRRLMRERRAPP